MPGGKPTVYVGSYDARFYALDAKTGKVRWKHKAPGRISGAATVVGDIVYFGDLKSRTTTGLGARTGRKVFRLGRGGFNPVVSDGRYLYLVGYSSLVAAQAEDGALSARTGTPAAARCCLSSATE